MSFNVARLLRESRTAHPEEPLGFIIDSLPKGPTGKILNNELAV
jgi:hypothetical protein